MDSSRISLRRFKLSDVDDFFKWVSDERVTKIVRWEPITTKEEAEAFLQNVAIPHPWFHSICLDDRSIGYAAFWQRSGDEKLRGDLGMSIGPDNSDRGIGTLVLKMVLVKLFKDIPELVRVEARTLLANKRSQRVLEKVGFLREGILRKFGIHHGEVIDFYMFSFLSTDKIDLPSSLLSRL